MKKTSLIVALDVPSANDIRPVLLTLPSEVTFYKVGLELFCASGLEALAPLKEQSKQIFLDLKLHDIPRTVERAVHAAAQHGVNLLTLHASGGRAMLKAAADAARKAGPGAPKLLAVTVLTSLDGADLSDLGISRNPSDQVLALGKIAIESGLDGLVCSAHEAARLRRELGPEPLLVTPGIRPAGGAAGDQKRIGTPLDAIQSGATHLVVGRPILEASDPADAARRILAEIESAHKSD